MLLAHTASGDGRFAILVVGWELPLAWPMTRFSRIIFDQGRLAPYHEVSRLPQTVSAVGVGAPTLPRRVHIYARCDRHEPYHNLEVFFEGCLDVGHHTILEGMRLVVG